MVNMLHVDFTGLQRDAPVAVFSQVDLTISIATFLKLEYPGFTVIKLHHIVYGKLIFDYYEGHNRAYHDPKGLKATVLHDFEDKGLPNHPLVVWYPDEHGDERIGIGMFDDDRDLLLKPSFEVLSTIFKWGYYIPPRDLF